MTNTTEQMRMLAAVEHLAEFLLGKGKTVLTCRWVDEATGKRYQTEFRLNGEEYRLTNYDQESRIPRSAPEVVGRLEARVEELEDKNLQRERGAE